MPRARSPVSASSTETILEPFRKSWPAMMLLVVLSGLGYGAYQFMVILGSPVSSYVISSGQNVDALMKASADSAAAHGALQQAMAHALASSVDTRDQVVINGEKLAELYRMLKETSDLLRSSPTNQEAQMQALTRIEKAVQDLTILMEKAPRLPAGKSTPAP